MVERDEGSSSRNGKRSDGSDRKQQSPPTFVNHFAKFMESKVSYAEALRLGHKNLEIHRQISAQGDSGTNNADGTLSRSYSTPSFDSSAPSTPSLPHSISSPDLENQDSQTENNNSSAGHYSPNSSSSAIAKRCNSDPSALSKSSNPLYFGKLKSCLSLPKSFPHRYASTSSDLETSSNGKTPSPTPPRPSRSRISDPDILREELQRLIKRTMESGRLQRQCANCGSSKHCCGQTILEAVSSIPPSS